MTPRDFVQTGHGEAIKGTVHVLVASLLGVMTAYNATAFIFRHQRHLAINALLYGAGCWYELRQTARHWRRLWARQASTKRAVASRF